jgi:hypothetical protein
MGRPRYAPHRGVRSWVLILCALTALLLCCPAHAEQQHPLRIVLRTETGCANLQQLARQIWARTPRARWARNAEPAWDFEITIRVTGTRAWANLVVVDPAGRQSARQLAGRDCSELVEALGLILALTVDSTARTEPTSNLTPPPKAAPHTQPPAAVPPAPPIRPTMDRSGWAFGGGVAGFAIAGVAPSPMPGVEGFLETTSVGQGWLHPSLRASLRLAQAAGFEAAGGTAAFRLTVGALEGCPVWLGWASWGGLRPCAFGELGTLRAAGSNTIDPQTVEKVWVAAGPALRLELSPMRGLVLEGRVGLAVPIRRGRFWFVPEVFHEVRPVCIEGSVGVAGRFR